MIIQSEFSFMGVKGLKKMYYSACEKYKGRKKSEPLKAVEPVTLLRAIYTVQLCCMRQAYDRPTTRIVLCKSNLQLTYDYRVHHKKCRRILNHVLKSYDNRTV